MENDKTTDDACSIALDAALSVIGEKCDLEAEEPEQGRFLRLHLKQEIKSIHALAKKGDESYEIKAANVLKQIDIGIENEMLSPEYGQELKRSVKMSQ